MNLKIQESLYVGDSNLIGIPKLTLLIVFLCYWIIFPHYTEARVSEYMIGIISCISFEIVLASNQQVKLLITIVGINEYFMSGSVLE